MLSNRIDILQNTLNLDIDMAVPSLTPNYKNQGEFVFGYFSSAIRTKTSMHSIGEIVPLEIFGVK